MSTERKLTCDELCDEMVRQRTRAEKAEAKLAEAEKEKSYVWDAFKVIQANCDGALKENLEIASKLAEAQEQAFRSGYKAGATAVNTVGVEALGHVEFHFKKWRNNE